MSASVTGLVWDSRRRKWLYQPAPMSAGDCEAVAAIMHPDGWAEDLLAAAEQIRQREADARHASSLRIVLRDGLPALRVQS